MKTKLLLLLVVCTGALLAQNPKLISYQGVARGTDGSPVLNQAVSIRFNILQGSVSGAVVFTETQALNTDERGYIHTQIGLVNNLTVINWKNGPYYLEVAIDMTGGNNLQVLGIQQIVGVPYSFYASTVPSSYSATTGVLDIGGNTYTLNTTPVTTITGQGRANVTNPSTNVFVVDVPYLQVSTTSTAGGVAIGGSGTGSVNLNIPAPITPTINGAGAASVLPATVGNNFTISVPPLGITLTQTGTTAGFSSAGINSVNINVPSQVVPNIVGAGLVNVTTLGNNYIVNVPVLSYTPSTAALGSGTNNLSILQSLGLSGTALYSGPLSNSINLAPFAPWRQGVSTVTLTNATDRVGIGGNNPIENLQVESTTSSSVSLLSSTTGTTDLAFGTSANHGLGKVRYDNTTNTMSFWTNSTNRGFINNAGQMVVGSATPYAATTGLTIGRAGAINNQLMIVGGDATNSYGGILSFGENINPSVGMSLKLDAGGNRLMFTNDLTGTNPVMSIGGYLGTNNGIAVGTGYAGGINPPADGMVVQGNVGIGTTAPVSPLDVAGSSTFEGNITVGTGTSTPADARIYGSVRMGTETLTAQAPLYPTGSTGMVIRRINSYGTVVTGAILAATNTMNFERDGSNGGFRVNVVAGNGFEICHCMGTNNAGVSVNKSFSALPSGVTQIYTNAENVVYFHCMFGNPFVIGHITEVSLSRYNGDYYWMGTTTSTYNQ